MSDYRMKWCELLVPKRYYEEGGGARAAVPIQPFLDDLQSITFNSAFRRMQDKAQVFPMERWDFARTRLTHSLEASAVAEVLGNMLVAFLRSGDESVPRADCEGANELISGIPTILKSAALIHDMGNPPFGHLGEKDMSLWFKENLGRCHLNEDGGFYFSDVSTAQVESLAGILSDQQKNDLCNFDGNTQLFRILCHLQKDSMGCYMREDAGKKIMHGMNLTYPLMATVVKYPVASTGLKDVGFHKKVGFFAAEQGRYEIIAEALGLVSYNDAGEKEAHRHPLTFLLEAADDIAYRTADIEDAYKRDLVGDGCVREALDKVAGSSGSGKEGVRALCSRLRQELIRLVFDEFKTHYGEIMEGRLESDLVSCSSCASAAIKVLSDTMIDKVYYCDQIMRAKTQSTHILGVLMEKFVPCVFNTYERKENERGKFKKCEDDKYCLLASRVSDDFKEVCIELTHQKNVEIDQGPSTKDAKKHEKLQWETYYKLLLVTDYVSGMTDRYACNIFRLVEGMDSYTGSR